MTCSRPGCSEVATTRLLFDARAAIAVLDTKLDEWGGSGVLCARHSERITLPKGWTLDDRRITAPRLFPVSRFDEPRRLAGENAAARTRRYLTPLAQIDSLPLGSVHAAVPEAPHVHPDQAVFDLADVRTPMLARAFESASRIRSSGGLNALIPAGSTQSESAAVG